MNYLVLGGSGFIGRHLIESLLTKGKVRVFDKKGNFLEDDFPQIEVVCGDFSDANFKELLSNIDVVYHLISTTVPVEGTQYSISELTDNVIPTLKLLNEMVEQKIKRIIFISSAGTVYGDINDDAKEDYQLNPICSYGVQKVSIENYLRIYKQYHNISPIVVRLSNPYGTGQDINKKQGVIPIFLNKILTGQTLELWGDGTVVRDYLHIDDAVEALQKLEAYSGDYDTFNVASGESLDLLEIIRIIERESGVKANIKFLPSRKCDVKKNAIDVTRIFKECGWKARIDITTGIRILVKSHIQAKFDEKL
jgi:UDP-glucose 4-epimerase